MKMHIVADIEMDCMRSRYREVVERWGLTAGERRGLERAGSAATAEARMRQLVDVDRAASSLLGDPALPGLWARTSNLALRGATPIAAMTSVEGALREIRDALRRELDEAGRHR